MQTQTVRGGNGLQIEYEEDRHTVRIGGDVDLPNDPDDVDMMDEVERLGISCIATSYQKLSGSEFEISLESRSGLSVPDINGKDTVVEA